ncbi:cytochrome P450-like protein, partial [Mycena olivaceomarginata]
YPDPHMFKPERFLLDGKINSSGEELQGGFGFGRRLCPGRHMAHSSICVTVVSILATFDITQAMDERERLLSRPRTHSSSSTPLPFKCSITPRSQETVALIQ